MSDSSSYNSGGIGFIGLLTILFVGLKLTGFITWSWWLVLLPMIVPFSIWLVFMVFVLYLFLKDINK